MSCSITFNSASKVKINISVFNPLLFISILLYSHQYARFSGLGPSLLKSYRIMWPMVTGRLENTTKHHDFDLSPPSIMAICSCISPYIWSEVVGHGNLLCISLGDDVVCQCTKQPNLFLLWKYLQLVVPFVLIFICTKLLHGFCSTVSSSHPVSHNRSDFQPTVFIRTIMPIKPVDCNGSPVVSPRTA